MSNKQLVIELLEKLPEEATLLEIAREVEFLDGVRTLAQAGRGEFVSVDEKPPVARVVKPVRSPNGRLRLPVRLEPRAIAMAVRKDRDAL
jgi:hypothetical protein